MFSMALSQQTFHTLERWTCPSPFFPLSLRRTPFPLFTLTLLVLKLSLETEAFGPVLVLAV